MVDSKTVAQGTQALQTRSSTSRRLICGVEDGCKDIQDVERQRADAGDGSDELGSYSKGFQYSTMRAA